MKKGKKINKINYLGLQDRLITQKLKGCFL
jgi:hypothetical protein